MVFGLIFAFSLFGFSAVFGYGGGGGSAIPPIITSINVPMNLTFSQEGTLISNFGQQATVEVVVPKNASFQCNNF